MARRKFAHYGQPTDPGHPTSKVVKTEVFATSRNPLYLGGVIVFLGAEIFTVTNDKIDTFAIYFDNSPFPK